MEKPLMKPYTGIKAILASEPMTKEEYNQYRGWEAPEGRDKSEMVVLVEYAPDPLSLPNHPAHKGYISMSPVHVFNKAYMPQDVEVPEVITDIKAA